MSKRPRQLIGVNLGGWLIVEKWLTEDLFAGTEAWDEYELMRTAGGPEKVEYHRREYITRQDFAWLAQHGINAVRIPVGYWLFKAIDGLAPTVEYLDRAMKWAEEFDIAVLIDMHGAPGSQNGKMHSGRQGETEWFLQAGHQEQTIRLLEEIARRYYDSPALWGIELLNEPAARWHYWALLGFYHRAYRRLRAVARPGTCIVFHDGFHPLLFAGALWSRRSHPVVMDAHWYGFSAGRQHNLRHYLRTTARRRRLLLWWLRLFQPVIIGEWSTVLPQTMFDRAPATEHRGLLTENAEMQVNVYGRALGYFYWNYKAQGRGMWHYRSLIEDGVIKPPRMVE